MSLANKDGDTALHFAGTPEMVLLLLEHGADVNAKNLKGNTPLHEACNPTMARFLLANGADINTKNNHGLTPPEYIRKNGLSGLAGAMEREAKILEEEEDN